MNSKLSARTWSGLILCNLVWSFHPVMGKWLLEDFTPVQGAWMRYTSAFLTYLICYPLLKAQGPRFINAPRGDLVKAVLLGTLAFCLTPLAQLSGLNASQATDNSIIIAMEPLMTVILAWIILKERLGIAQVIAFSIALLGFALLTEMTPARLSLGMDAHLVGNVVILFSLLGEASYSVLGRELTRRYRAISIYGTASACGAILLTGIGFFYLGPGLFAFNHFTLKSGVALAWLGPVGTTGAYLYWISMLVSAPVSTLAITLFCQPLFGALWGHLFLGEHLQGIQYLGTALILGAVSGHAAIEIHRSKRL